AENSTSSPSRPTVAEAPRLGSNDRPSMASTLNAMLAPKTSCPSLSGPSGRASSIPQNPRASSGKASHSVGSGVVSNQGSIGPPKPPASGHAAAPRTSAPSQSSPTSTSSSVNRM